MRFFRRILGLNSPYSWVKWIRISALIVAVIAAGLFVGYAATMGIFGVILFVILLVPIFAVMLVIALGIGAIIGAVQGGRKQAASFRESRSTGSAELVALDRMRFRVQLLTFLFYVLLVVFIIACIAAYIGAGVVALIACIVVCGAILVFYMRSLTPLQAKYQNVFKQEVVRKELEAFLTVHTYEPYGKLDEAIVRECRLFPPYDHYNGNDFLIATRGDRSFMFSDLKLVKESERTYTDSDGDIRTETVYTTVFCGRLIVFDYDAVSNEPVFVFNRGNSRPAADEILTELDAFNRKFRILSADTATAFSILTPQVLNGIVMASDKLNCPMSFSFINDKLYVAMAIGDTMEAVSVGDATLSEMRQRVRQDVQVILDLVDNVYLIQRGQNTILKG